jgi:AcrR family transcriptional regulator
MERSVSDARAADNPYRRSLLRRERSRDTRRNLLRAAVALWSEKGYDQTTVEEICALAGVGRTTYYLHFQSKEQLLGEVSWATAAGVAEDVEASVGGGGLDQQLDAFVDGLAGRMESVPKAFASLVLGYTFGDTVKNPPPADAVVFDDVLAGIFDAAKRRGEITSKVDSADLGAVLAGMTMDALQRWAGGRDGSSSLRETLRLRVDLILDGIRT